MWGNHSLCKFSFYRPANLRLFLFVNLFLFCISGINSQELQRHELVCAYLYKFANNIEWPGEDQISEYRFKIISQDDQLLMEFRKLAKNIHLKGKPIRLISGEVLSGISDAHIIYLDKEKDKHFTQVSDAIKAKNVLLVSDNYPDKQLIMINLKDAEDKRLRFELNNENIINQGLKISPDIVLLGGTVVDVANLFRASQQSMQTLQEQLEALYDHQEELEQQINASRSRIDKQQGVIVSQNLSIDSQKNLISQQGNELQDLHIEISQKQDEIIRKADIILESEMDLQALQKEISDGNRILSDQQTKIDKQNTEIIRQIKTLEQQNIRITLQQNLIYLSVAFTMLIAGLLFSIFLGYKNKKKANKKLQVEIEERKRIEQELLRNQEELLKTERELRELNKTKDKFFSIISHDLRSPFNSIIGLSKMLAQDIKELSQEDIEEMALSISEASDNTYNLLNMLLEWSRVQRGKIDYKPRPLMLKEIILNNIDLLKHTAREKEIELTASTKDGINVYADVSMLNTIIRNLISNAIKFTPRGGSISVSMESNEKEATVRVVDTGVGIDAKDLGRLFSIDSKVRSKGTEDESGTGLGLILTKEFVEKNQGEIWVESEPGKGSCFSFTLPKQ